MLIISHEKLCVRWCVLVLVLVFHLHVIPSSSQQDFASSPFVKAMLYRTNIVNNRTKELVQTPRPELIADYRDVVMQALVFAQDATGQPLVQLTPVSLEVKKLLELGVFL
ncbi:unnamed protein product [Choristocarpus tenellus]